MAETLRQQLVEYMNCVCAENSEKLALRNTACVVLFTLTDTVY